MDARSTVVRRIGLLVVLACLTILGEARALGAQTVDVFAGIDRAFDEYRLDARVPGLVYGIVMDGRLVHVQAFGVQDLDSNRPVTPETLFRIASMSARLPERAQGLTTTGHRARLPGSKIEWVNIR